MEKWKLLVQRSKVEAISSIERLETGSKHTSEVDWGKRSKSMEIFKWRGKIGKLRSFSLDSINLKEEVTGKRLSVYGTRRIKKRIEKDNLVSWSGPIGNEN